MGDLSFTDGLASILRIDGRRRRFLMMMYVRSISARGPPMCAGLLGLLLLLLGLLGPSREAGGPRALSESILLRRRSGVRPTLLSPKSARVVRRRRQGPPHSGELAAVQRLPLPRPPLRRLRVNIWTVVPIWPRLPRCPWAPPRLDRSFGRLPNSSRLSLAILHCDSECLPRGAAPRISACNSANLVLPCASFSICKVCRV